jgi:hypothetical protein
VAVTTDAVLNDTLPTILESARYTEIFSAEMSALVWKIRKQLHDGKNINIPTFGTITAKNLTEGVDNIASETMSDAMVTVTPGEVGCKLILTDKMVRDNNEDVKSAAGRLLGDAMELKRDQDLLLQLASAATTMGAGAAITLGQIAASRAMLKGNPVTTGGPAPGQLVCVLHPFVATDLVDVFTPLVPIAGSANVGTSAIADDVIRNYAVGRLFGMTVLEDGNIDTTTIANTAKGGIFNIGEGSAIILATANEWSVEPERDASLRATELNITGEYGVGIYEDNWIVTCNNLADSPA